MTARPPRTSPMISSRPLTPSSLRKRLQRIGRRLARGNRQPGGEQRIGGLIGAEQRQADIDRLAARGEHACAGAKRSAASSSSRSVSPARPTVSDGAARASGRRDHLAGVLAVGVDDGHAIRRQQLGEQAQLGGEVGLHRRVIVEVVAAEVGEGRGLQSDAIEPELVEAVRGRLERQVRDALLAPAPTACGAGRRDRAW